MKAYISGRITGIDYQIATQNFSLASAFVRSMGSEPVNPLDLPHKHGGQWQDYMLEDLAALCHCQAIAMIANWKESHGARIELAFAKRIGLAIIYLPVDMRPCIGESAFSKKAKSVYEHFGFKRT